MFRLTVISWILSAFLVSEAMPCMTGGTPVSLKGAAKMFPPRPAVPRGKEPLFAKENPSPSIEARLANLLLKHGSAAVISIPTKLEISDYAPFKNGHKNAIMTHGKIWKLQDFPAYGVQVRGRRTYHFHSSTGVTKWKEKKISPHVYEVSPEGWSEGFRFDFTPAHEKLNAFLETVSPLYRTFGGREAPDPAQVGKRQAFKRLLSGVLGPAYRKEVGFSHVVHSRYPSIDGQDTATGGGLSWRIQDSYPGPFKHLYSCFEGRKMDQEDMKGVPSGTGWHQIGDSGVTLLNTLETAPIPIAVARSNVTQSAYGMTDLATAFWLQPQEVLITRKGESHWMVNPYTSEICLETWLQNCEPTPANSRGFNCPQ